jgi:Rrf2 family protein
MLSSKAKYAIRAALKLAERQDMGGWVQTADIAAEEAIPRKFLETILAQLRDHGFVDSRRGALGGYRLARPASEIAVADLLRAVDGPLALTPCASRTRFRPCQDCVDIRKCRLRYLMQRARDAVASVLENCSLAQLAAASELEEIEESSVAAGRGGIRSPESRVARGGNGPGR